MKGFIFKLNLLFIENISNRIFKNKILDNILSIPIIFMEIYII